ncbi:MAG: AAA family ATPase [Actinomycetaceae bacterium]|nr:AAA family ATPase [Actinomycetaceae bacterium]
MDIHTFLLDIAHYPDETGSIECVETHASRVYLAKNHVYKVKKPVDFGFLDFSTLEKRQHFCEEEVRLNRQFAGDAAPHLGVLALHKNGAGFSWEPTGDVVEYVVRMRRLPGNRMLAHLIQENAAELPARIDELAPLLAKIHASAPQVTAADFDDAASVAFNVRENFEQTAPFAPECIASEALAAAQRRIEAFLAQHTPLLQRRQAQGWVRQVHGDLHSEHICFTNPVQIYDCIEFNERFRTSDILCDIAFLIMDLQARGRLDLAQQLEKGWRKHIDAGEGADILLPFYKSYRAWVRGKVAAFTMAQQAAGSSARIELQKRSIQYLNLALGFLVRPSLVLTCGVMGSGKSYFAQHLATASGAEILRSDAVRKELAGLDASEKVHVPFGSGLYDEESTKHTYAALLERAEKLLLAGRPVIVDAAFTKQEQRAPFLALGAQLNVPTPIAYLHCDEATLRQRLDARNAKGNDISDGRFELLDAQRRSFNPPETQEGALQLDASLDVDAAVSRTLAQII